MFSSLGAPVNVEHLITEVEARPAIYDLRHPEYTNKDIRERYWEEIAATVGNPVHECKRKWRNVRDAFMREIRKEVKSEGPGPSKKKKYLHYDQMQFLVPILTNRRCLTGRTTLRYSGAMKQEKYEVEDEGDPGEEGGYWEELVETSLGASEEEDQDRQFLLSLLPMLSRLSERDRSSVRIQFQQILHNALYPPPQAPSPTSHQAFASFTQLLTALCLVLSSNKKN